MEDIKGGCTGGARDLAGGKDKVLNKKWLDDEDKAGLHLRTAARAQWLQTKDKADLEKYRDQRTKEP